MNRLHVHKITSVGVVEDADNPESEIVFWKAAPLTKAEARRQLKALRIEMQRKRPAMSRKDVEAMVLRAHPEIAAVLAKSAPKVGRESVSPGSGSALSPADWGPVVEKVVLARLDEQRQAIRKIRDSQRTIGETMTPRKPTIAPADTIRGQVDAIALEMVAKGEAPNLTAARPAVWKARPDLVAASRANQEGAAIHVPGGKTPKPDTIPERIAEIVKERADEMSGVTQWWNLSDVERRVIVWRTPQGRKLRAAYTDAMKRGDTKFTKSNAHPDAMKILKSWESDPAEGLR